MKWVTSWAAGTSSPVRWYNNNYKKTERMSEVSYFLSSWYIISCEMVQQLQEDREWVKWVTSWAAGTSSPVRWYNNNYKKTERMSEVSYFLSSWYIISCEMVQQLLQEDRENEWSELLFEQLVHHLLWDGTTTTTRRQREWVKWVTSWAAGTSSPVRWYNYYKKTERMSEVSYFLSSWYIISCEMVQQLLQEDREWVKWVTSWAAGTSSPVRWYNNNYKKTERMSEVSYFLSSWYIISCEMRRVLRVSRSWKAASTAW